MKQILSTAILFCTLVCTLSLTAGAAIFEDFTYTLQGDNTVKILNYTGDATHVVIPSHVNDSPVTAIGDHAFQSHTTLISVEIPQSVTSIGYSAFYKCHALNSVTLPESLISIADGAFAECTALTSIVLPNSVTWVGDGVFNKCSNLSSVTLSNQMPSIGYATFAECPSLTTITLPASVNTITQAAFHLTPLTDVYFLGTPPMWELVTIDYTNNLNHVLTTAAIHCSEQAPQPDVQPEVQPDTTPTTALAHLSDTALTVNGTPISVDAYAIHGNNYIKLRDLAAMIHGTNKNFEVTWNQELQSIELYANTPYTAVGGELVSGEGYDTTATLSTATIYLNGSVVDLTAYTINSNNFFKLRDVMALFDVAVGYDNDTRTATLDTTLPYVD